MMETCKVVVTLKSVARGPYNGGSARRLERGTLFRLQVYERVGISLIEVYERGGKFVISVFKIWPRTEYC